MFRTSGVYEQISEDCAFSIIYGEIYESLDLVANSSEVANIWVTGLRYGSRLTLHTCKLQYVPVTHFPFNISVHYNSGIY